MAWTEREHVNITPHQSDIIPSGQKGSLGHTHPVKYIRLSYNLCSIVLHTWHVRRLDELSKRKYVQKCNRQVLNGIPVR